MTNVTKCSVESCGSKAIARGLCHRCYERERSHGRVKQYPSVLNMHGLSNHYLERTYRSMRLRCENPNHNSYRYYGGRGIKVCERWKNLANFIADMGDRPPGTTLDRIDVNGDYEPSNCRWATPKQQTANRRGKV